MPRQHKTSEEVFIELVERRIRGSFIDNPNFKLKGGYYRGRPTSEVIHAVQELGRLLLEEIQSTKHLVLELDEKQESCHHTST